MKIFTTLSDQQLIDLYLEGNTNAFNTLVLRHKNKIYTAICILVKSHDIADDIFQQVFVKIIEKITAGQYNEEGKFINWALRIAHNMCMDHYRLKKRIPVLNYSEGYDAFENINLSEEGIDTKIFNADIHANLKSMLDRLSEEQREVIVLKHFADLSFKEIAELTNCSINTALGRMRYAITNLRKLNTEFQLV